MITDAQIAEWRKLRNEGLDSSIGEYTPPEFWLVLDELDALRKDAERYRYLRNRRPADVLNVSGPAAGCWIDCEGGEDKPYPLMLLTGADADAAIDAVMVAAPAVVLPNDRAKRNTTA